MITKYSIIRPVGFASVLALSLAGQTALAQTAPPPDLPALPSLPAAGSAAPAALPRTKPLMTTIGMDPVQPDFGAEADMVSTIGAETNALPPKKWNRSAHGFFRAPMLVGLGPKNDGSEGAEIHSPPRVVGRTSDQWEYIGLTPSPTATLYLSAENKNVKGTLVLAATTFFDTGYSNLDQMGGVSQAYLTLRVPDLFGNRGGVAWNVGSFSNRYGAAGPNQGSTGYYGTHLFGRTHVAGYSVTADYDLTDSIRIVAEQGFGNKLEVVPWAPLADNPPDVDYLPEQGPVPQGSNFLHHAHLALEVGDALTVRGHHMVSFSPNDRGPVGVESEPAQLSVYGGEVHLDHETAGHGYIGYSRTDAVDVLPLSNALQVVHGGTGLDFARTFFPTDANDPGRPEDTGTVDSVLGQYILRLRPLLGKAEGGPDAALSVYGMFNHATTPTGFEQDRLKVGAELQVSPLPAVSIGGRFDQVMADGGDTDFAHQAISPRLIIHTDFMSREYVILNYTHYILGDNVRPSRPYEALAKPDPDMFTLSALVSF